MYADDVSLYLCGRSLDGGVPSLFAAFVEVSSALSKIGLSLAFPKSGVVNFSLSSAVLRSVLSSVERP